MRFTCLVVAAGIVLSMSSVGRADPPEGFIALFNGKNLEGWKATGKAEVWGVEEEKGILFVQGGGGGWLLTDKEYTNFELRLDYKMPKMGNSGVALRTPLEGNPAYVGMEIQLLDDENWKDQKLQPFQQTGSIYGVVPASEVTSKPFGQWNSMTIIAKGRRVSIIHNGKKVVDANLDEHKEHFKEHPGLTRAGGHLGFQSYNFRVEFKNIYLKPL